MEVGGEGVKQSNLIQGEGGGKGELGLKTAVPKPFRKKKLTRSRASKQITRKRRKGGRKTMGEKDLLKKCGH